MEKPKIYTNYHKRELLALADIPEELWSDFDYIEEEERFYPRLVKYRGNYYDIGDMPALRNRENPFGDFWHAGMNDSFYSGVLIHVCENNESVICGLFTS